MPEKKIEQMHFPHHSAAYVSYWGNQRISLTNYYPNLNLTLNIYAISL